MNTELRACVRSDRWVVPALVAALLVAGLGWRAGWRLYAVRWR